MLSKPNNDLLNEAGPGTPAGKLLRGYWQPVYCRRLVATRKAAE